MTIPAALLQQAFELHHSRRYADAEQVYRELLEISVRCAEAHYGLGLALSKQGQPIAAIASFREAIRLQPSTAGAHLALANLLRAQRSIDPAIGCYQEALRQQPDSLEALLNLAALLRSCGRHDQAADYFQRALEINPQNAAAHCNLALTRQAQGRGEEALTMLREAVRLWPELAQAHTALGITLAKQEQHEEALPSLREAVRLDPKFAEGHYRLGLSLAQQQLDEAAVASLREAIRLQPTMVDARVFLANLLRGQRLFDAAIDCYQEALHQQPDSLEALTNLAVALRSSNRYAEAAECFERVLAIDTQNAVAHCNLGLTQQDLGRSEVALAMLRESVHRWPGLPQAHIALGVMLDKEGQHEAALDSLREAVGLAPQSAEAHVELGTALLRLGHFTEGWTEHEWRRKTPRKGICPAGPEWRGEPLDGRIVLLHVEQGLGDSLQFIRYAPLVQQRGGKVLVACEAHSRLIPLLSSCAGIEQFCAYGESVPAHHVHASLLSLPCIFGTELDTIPTAVPYLYAPDDLIELWRDRFDCEHRLKVGIHWQGNRTYSGDHLRSIPLAVFAPLAAHEGVRLISLQKGFGSEQLAQVEWPVENLGAQLDEDGRAFCETAAVMKNLDLVITSDTSIAHLAGALGVPVWLALQYVPDWRWLLTREDSPWYPTMRLFRQTRPGDWQGVVARIAAAVQDKLQKPRLELG